MDKKRIIILAAAALIPALVLLLPEVPWARESKPGDLLASRIIDKEVVNAEGEKIGEVDDLVIRRGGRVKNLTLETGGFWDIADKRVAVSMNQIEIDREGGVVSSISKEQLTNKSEFSYYERGLRPEYFYRALPYPGDPYYRRPAYSPDDGTSFYAPSHYYGDDRRWTDYPPGPGRRNYRPRYASGADSPRAWMLSPGKFLASVVIDRYLVNNSGDQLGYVEDLIIDPEKTQVDRLVISSDEILGDDQYAAIDYRPLGFTAYGLVYDISIQEVKDAPQYPYED